MPPFATAFVPQFEEILTVLDRLTGFALVPVEVPSRDVALALGKWLRLQGRRIHIVFEDKQWKTLTAAIVADPPGDGGMTLVVFPREMSAETRSALRLLNQRRDTVAARLGVPLLWCGSADFLGTTAELAPDFWSVRDLPLRVQVPVKYADSRAAWNITLHNPAWWSKPEIAGPMASDTEPTTDAETQLREARASFEIADNQAGVVQTTLALAHLLERKDRVAEAAALLEGVLHLASEVDDWEQEARVLKLLALLEYRTEQLGRARESLERARLRLERLNDQDGLADVYRISSFVFYGSADLEGAIRDNDRAAVILESSGNILAPVSTLLLGAAMRLKGGDPEGAVGMLQRAWARVRNVRNESILQELVDQVRVLPESVASERATLLTEIEAHRRTSNPK